MGLTSSLKMSFHLFRIIQESSSVGTWDNNEIVVGLMIIRGKSKHDYKSKE